MIKTPSGAWEMEFESQDLYKVIQSYSKIMALLGQFFYLCVFFLVFTSFTSLWQKLVIYLSKNVFTAPMRRVSLVPILGPWARSRSHSWSQQTQLWGRRPAPGTWGSCCHQCGDCGGEYGTEETDEYLSIINPPQPRLGELLSSEHSRLLMTTSGV